MSPGMRWSYRASVSLSVILVQANLDKKKNPVFPFSDSVKSLRQDPLRSGLKTSPNSKIHVGHFNTDKHILSALYSWFFFYPTNVYFISYCLISF